MSYLSRENSPLSEKLWEQIDQTVIGTARKTLVCRRFLHIFGPLGAGVTGIHIDDANEVDEIYEEGLMTTKGRRYVEIPTIYDDFTLLSRDLESSTNSGYPADLSKAAYSAEAAARKEDRLILFGSAGQGYEGIFATRGTEKLKRSDWTTGENAFADLVKGLEAFTKKGIFGAYTLIISPDLFLPLQRLQPGTGLLEIDRMKTLLNGNVFTSSVLGIGKAALLCPEARYMDLVIGQDLAAAYLEQKDLNHNFRLLENVLFRLKNRQAVIVYE